MIRREVATTPDMGPPRAVFIAFMVGFALSSLLMVGRAIYERGFANGAASVGASEHDLRIGYHGYGTETAWRDLTVSDGLLRVHNAPGSLEYVVPSFTFAIGHDVHTFFADAP